MNVTYSWMWPREDNELGTLYHVEGYKSESKSFESKFEILCSMTEAKSKLMEWEKEGFTVAIYEIYVTGGCDMTKEIKNA